MEAKKKKKIHGFGGVILIIISMFTITVILSNILIAQLSYRYEMAMDEAEVQYCIDKTKFTIKVERSRFLTKNLRVAHYIDKDYVAPEDLLPLLEDWMKVKKNEGEDAKERVRTILEDDTFIEKKQD